TPPSRPHRRGTFGCARCGPTDTRKAGPSRTSSRSRERIVAGKPQQNGSHERVHRTLKEETAMPPADNVPAQQQRFDDFRAIYNNERPHEALGQKTPASLYEPSPRPYPDRIDDPSYDADVAIRRVRSNGQIKWAGELIFVGEAL